MMESDVIPYLSLMGIVATVAADSSVKVSQYPPKWTTMQGEDVKFTCRIDGNHQTSDAAFHWWKEGESEHLHNKPNNGKIFDSKIFQLLNVTFHDSGVYFCAVIHRGKVAINGTGSHLIVQVLPTPLKIFHRDSERDSANSLTLVCETAAFFPEDIKLTWLKDGNELKTVMNFTKENNSNGLYEVSSYLYMEETQPLECGVVYTCLVSHVSLQYPAVASYRVSTPNTGFDEIDAQPHYGLIAGCVGGGLIFLLLLIIIKTHYKLNKRKGSHRSQNISGHCEDQAKHAAENTSLSYATLNLTSSRKISKPKRQEESTVYAQTLQGAGNESVIYAKVDLKHCKKTPRPKQQDERTVYSQTNQRAAGNNLTYSALDLHSSKKTGKPKRTVENIDYAEIHVRNHGGRAVAISREPRSK